MQSKLDNLKNRLKSEGDKVSIATEFYLLAKELGCLGDLIGREYELEYDKDRVVGFRQKPMKISQFISMMSEFQADVQRQNKQMKKSKRKR